jgi:hypothetical protein
MFGVPMFLALLTNAGLLWLIVGPDPMDMGHNAAPVFCELLIGGAVVMVADVHALGWVGMWMALRKNRHHQAILATVGRVLAVPWLALLFVWFLGIAGAFRGTGDTVMVFLLWHGLGFVIDLVSAEWAKGELLSGLRQARAEARTMEDGG